MMLAVFGTASYFYFVSGRDVAETSSPIDVLPDVSPPGILPDDAFPDDGDGLDQPSRPELVVP